MLYKIFSIVICILSISVSAMAQETSPVAVDKMVFCRGIQDRNPVGAATHFPDSVVRVFCYSRLTSSVEKTSISHVWYYNDTQMAIVDLPVNGSPWRTWSSKRIVKEWSGQWRVDVISEDGVVIYSDGFVITTASE